MMKNTLILALIATLPAFAQENVQKPEFPQQPAHWGANGQMPDRKGRPDMHRRMLEKLDTNKDGKLDEAEMEAMKPKHGHPVDRVGNSKRGEGFPRPEGMEHPGNRRRPHSERPEMIERFDADKNGMLDEQEHGKLKAEAGKNRKGRPEHRGPKAGKRGERPMPPVNMPEPPADAPAPFKG